MQKPHSVLCSMRPVRHLGSDRVPCRHLQKTPSESLGNLSSASLLPVRCQSTTDARLQSVIPAYRLKFSPFLKPPVSFLHDRFYLLFLHQTVSVAFFDVLRLHSSIANTEEKWCCFCNIWMTHEDSLQTVLRFLIGNCRDLALCG